VSITGIITTYLILRLLVIRGFPNIYPDRSSWSVLPKGAVSDISRPSTIEPLYPSSYGGLFLARLYNRGGACYEGEDFARNQLQRSGGVRDSRIGFTHVGDLYGK